MRDVLTVMAVCAGWCSERPGMCCAQGVVIIGVAYMYCTPPCDVTAPPQRMSPNCRGGRGISLDRNTARRKVRGTSLGAGLHKLLLFARQLHS